MPRRGRTNRFIPKTADRSCCPVCGYSSGLAPGRGCPECGETLEANVDGFRRQRAVVRRRVLMGVIGVVVAAIVMLWPILSAMF